jgi:orotidine-5'-phosphate decarboxylase
LALTSNQGANDFQFQANASGEKLFETVLDRSTKWGSPENLMYVVGATRAEGIKEVRDRVPDHFFLVPGVGAQGGSLEEVAEYGWNVDCGLLVNSSRGIIYASSGDDFATVAGEKAKELQIKMADILARKGF